MSSLDFNAFDALHILHQQKTELGGLRACFLSNTDGKPTLLNVPPLLPPYSGQCDLNVSPPHSPPVLPPTSPR